MIGPTYRLRVEVDGHRVVDLEPDDTFEGAAAASKGARLLRIELAVKAEAGALPPEPVRHDVPAEDSHMGQALAWLTEHPWSSTTEARRAGGRSLADGVRNLWSWRPELLERRRYPGVRAFEYRVRV